MRKIFLIFAFTTLLSSCDLQDEGDRCERNDDCKDDFICCIRLGEHEGTCQKQENCSIEKKALSIQYLGEDYE